MSVLSSFFIGKLLIDPPLLLAPMAGLTHVAFRQLVGRYGGCGLTVSEMLSARAILHEKLEDSLYLRKIPGEHPFFYQLIGNDPTTMAAAITRLAAFCDGNGAAMADGFDINMGCGAPRLRNSGLGSGLLQNPELSRRVIAACRRATALPLTVKMRLVAEDDPARTLAFARMLQDEGVEAITLHPRFGKEKFKKLARWDYVTRLKTALSIPVIGNGDIHRPEEVERRLAETGCDGIMIGRQAVVQPWIFRTAAGRAPIRIDLAAVYQDFAVLLTENFPPEKRLGRLKQYSHYFAKNFRFGHHLATAIQTASSQEEALERAEAFFASQAGERMVDSGMGP